MASKDVPNQSSRSLPLIGSETLGRECLPLKQAMRALEDAWLEDDRTRSFHDRREKVVATLWSFLAAPAEYSALLRLNLFTYFSSFPRTSRCKSLWRQCAYAWPVKPGGLSTNLAWSEADAVFVNAGSSQELSWLFGGIPKIKRFALIPWTEVNREPEAHENGFLSIHSSTWKEERHKLILGHTVS